MDFQRYGRTATLQGLAVIESYVASNDKLLIMKRPCGFLMVYVSQEHHHDSSPPFDHPSMRKSPIDALEKRPQNVDDPVIHAEPISITNTFID